MTELFFEEDADSGLRDLEQDPTRAALLLKVNAVLDLLEENERHPDLPTVHQFQSHEKAVVVHAGRQSCAVMWEDYPKVPGALAVIYIGPLGPLGL